MGIYKPSLVHQRLVCVFFLFIRFFPLIFSRFLFTILSWVRLQLPSLRSCSPSVLKPKIIRNPPHATVTWFHTARPSVTHWPTCARTTEIVAARPAKILWWMKDVPKAILCITVINRFKGWEKNALVNCIPTCAAAPVYRISTLLFDGCCHYGSRAYFIQLLHAKVGGIKTSWKVGGKMKLILSIS